MFLASAGRIYSRKTAQEEFTRYVHDCDVVQTLTTAMVRLYELPIKPINVEEYFAEFLENGAKNVVHLSMLRAELCYKKAEARDLMARLEKLDKDIFNLEQKAEDASSKKGRLYNRETYDQDENQYEVMRRFFRDLQAFSPGMLSQNNSIIFKSDERKWGGETETGILGKNIEDLDTVGKVDSYQEFLKDIHKLDPWGIIFPHPRKEDTFLKDIPPPDTEMEDKELKDYRLKSRWSLLKAHRDNKLRRNKSKPDNDGSNNKNDWDVDDSRSLAELFHQQRQTQKSQQEQNPNLNDFNIDQALNYDNERCQGIENVDKENVNQENENENENENEGEMEVNGNENVENFLHYWDTQYWYQFFKDGAEIVPPLVKLPDVTPLQELYHKSTKSNLHLAPGENLKDRRPSKSQSKAQHLTNPPSHSKVNRKPTLVSPPLPQTPGFQFQYINPKSPPGQSSDNDKDHDAKMSKQKERRSSSIHPDAIVGPLEIQESLAAHRFHLQNIWTAPHFVYGPVPTRFLLGDLASLDSKRTKQSLRPRQSITFSKSGLRQEQKQHFRVEPDVIDTDVSFGDPPLLCGKPVRTYSKAVRQTPSSRASLSHYRGESRRPSKLMTPRSHTDVPRQQIFPSSKPGASLPVRVNNSEMTSATCSKTEANQPNKYSVRPSTPVATTENESETEYEEEYEEEEEEDNEQEEEMPTDSDIIRSRRTSAPRTAKGQVSEGEGKKKRESTSRGRSSSEPREKKLSKIAQGAIVIPKYEGDGPKQIPFSRSYVSEEEESGNESKRQSRSGKSGSRQARSRSSRSNSKSSRARSFCQTPQKLPAKLSSRKSVALPVTRISRTVQPSQSKTNSLYRRSSLHGNEDPCDPAQVNLFHPYPDLLTLPKIQPDDKKNHSYNPQANTANKKRDESVKRKKKMQNKYARLFSHHYEQETVDKIMAQYDLKLFEGM